MAQSRFVKSLKYGKFEVFIDDADVDFFDKHNWMVSLKGHLIKHPYIMRWVRG